MALRNKRVYIIQIMVLWLGICLIQNNIFRLVEAAEGESDISGIKMPSGTDIEDVVEKKEKNKKKVKSAEKEALTVIQKSFEDKLYSLTLKYALAFFQNYPDSKNLAWVHLIAGKSAYYQNKLHQALGEFETILQKWPAVDIADEVIYWCGEVNFKGGDYKAAQNYYQQLIAKFPDSKLVLHAYYTLGLALYNQNQLARSIETFKFFLNKFALFLLEQLNNIVYVFLRCTKAHRLF